MRRSPNSLRMRGYSVLVDGSPTPGSHDWGGEYIYCRDEAEGRAEELAELCPEHKFEVVRCRAIFGPTLFERILGLRPFSGWFKRDNENTNRRKTDGR